LQHQTNLDCRSGVSYLASSSPSPSLPRLPLLLDLPSLSNFQAILTSFVLQRSSHNCQAIRTQRFVSSCIIVQVIEAIVQVARIDRRAVWFAIVVVVLLANGLRWEETTPDVKPLPCQVALPTPPLPTPEHLEFLCIRYSSCCRLLFRPSGVQSTVFPAP
jgi:hypothetical protein